VPLLVRPIRRRVDRFFMYPLQSFLWKLFGALIALEPRPPAPNPLCLVEAGTRPRAGRVSDLSAADREKTAPENPPGFSGSNSCAAQFGKNASFGLFPGGAGFSVELMIEFDRHYGFHFS
jgi:hypothetical protein